MVNHAWTSRCGTKRKTKARFGDHPRRSRACSAPGSDRHNIRTEYLTSSLKAEWRVHGAMAEPRQEVILHSGNPTNQGTPGNVNLSLQPWRLRGEARGVSGCYSRDQESEVKIATLPGIENTGLRDGNMGPHGAASREMPRPGRKDFCTSRGRGMSIFGSMARAPRCPGRLRAPRGHPHQDETLPPDRCG